MDVMTFKRYYEMVCNVYKNDCLNCPVCRYCNILDKELYIRSLTPEIVTVVKNIVENDIISRQQLFLEQYPNAEMTPDGVLVIAPCVIEPSQRQSSICIKHHSSVCTNRECEICREQYWGQLMIKGEDGKYHEKI